VNDILEAFKDEFIKAAPVIVAALVGVIVAGFAWLKQRMALVREVVTDSALRQAKEAHGSDPAAFQAAADELHRIPVSMRPKDVPAAVEKAMQRARESEMPPPLEPPPVVADVCGKRCSHESECLRLKHHDGVHETQHGCVFYEPTAPTPASPLNPHNPGEE
jgi:hypothetical protein